MNSDFKGVLNLLGATQVKYLIVSANILSKADLILAKRASGRPQDLIDAETLENAP